MFFAGLHRACVASSPSPTPLLVGVWFWLVSLMVRVILRVRLLFSFHTLCLSGRCKCGDEGKNESILPLKGIRPPVHVDKTRAESTCSCRVISCACLHLACVAPSRFLTSLSGIIYFLLVSLRVRVIIRLVWLCFYCLLLPFWMVQVWR